MTPREQRTAIIDLKRDLTLALAKYDKACSDATPPESIRHLRNAVHGVVVACDLALKITEGE
jgi:hypothetical protein